MGRPGRLTNLLFRPRGPARGRNQSAKYYFPRWGQWTGRPDGGVGAARSVCETEEGGLGET